MPIRNAAGNVFSQLIDSVNRLTVDQYTSPCNNLMQSSIGQHVRHIIELFQCLERGYDSGIVDYDSRQRDHEIESDKELAVRLLEKIFENLGRPDKELYLLAEFDDNKLPLRIKTNYYRELAYNLEHSIHHMALIRVGISEVSDIELSAEYGVASSTLKYRQQCAQ